MILMKIHYYSIHFGPRPGASMVLKWRKLIIGKRERQKLFWTTLKMLLKIKHYFADPKYLLITRHFNRIRII
jgi:hypothetical protein